jgi:hypothetical protein
MVKVSRSGAVRTMISWRNVQQSTDRIARTLINAPFLAVGIVIGHRPRAIGYHPPRQLPPAERPPGNEPFSRSFSFPLVIAVGAVGILTSFTDGL